MFVITNIGAFTICNSIKYYNLKKCNINITRKNVYFQFFIRVCYPIIWDMLKHFLSGWRIRENVLNADGDKSWLSEFSQTRGEESTKINWWIILPHDWAEQTKPLWQVCILKLYFHNRRGRSYIILWNE